MIASLTMTKVLIIEDDRSIADVLAYNLRQDGYEVLQARDGREGLYEAQVKMPDIVVLDLMLPGIDGLRGRTSSEVGRARTS